MDQINSKHVPFFILATIIVSAKTYPTIYTKNGGRESWIAMIIASIIMTLFLVYVIKASLKHNCFNLYDIYTSALGKPMGNIFIGFLLLTLFLTLVESAAVYSNALHNHLLMDTPVWFFLLLFLTSTLYTVKKDLVAIIIVTLIGIVLVTISGINLAILTVKYKEVAYLLPVFERGVTIGFIKSIGQILGLFAGVIVIFPLLKRLGDTKNLLLYVVIGLLFALQIHIVSLTGLFMTFDVHFINYMTYPNLFQTQLVSHFRFLEMGELFVMLQIVGGWYLKYVITFYGLLSILREMKQKSKYWVYGISIVVAICAYFAGDNLFLLFKLLNYYTYIVLVNFFVIPLFVFGIFSKRGLQIASKDSI
ncbi:endospore germination permease [Alkaliphilus peptidifermentans]|uniref:Spore germination protein (Amino acid permease) n=1 Tax=Alkaliphilus peptidifermentans DSM 18978 TaxID=1120976 RepID=A0A1G5CWH7_9FIRM|nr:endospore germination permease [Alkaliphilus peptidifermentans]SCY06611.1 spore germination protein (amino acid permease) [Alkaliphilus peptidifermentans DSM 18978]